MRQQKVERDLSRVVGVPALLRAQGMTAGSRIVSTGMVAADDETAQALGLGRGRLRRSTWCGSGSPTAPRSRSSTCGCRRRSFPGLLDLPLGGSLYELLAGALRHRAGRGGGAHRGGRRRARTRRPSSASSRARRCCRSPARPRTPTAARSSSPTTCSAPTAPSSPCARRQRPARDRGRGRVVQMRPQIAVGMTDRTALVVANATDADTGYVGERLVQRGYTLRTVLRDRGEIPRPTSTASTSCCCSARSGRCTRRSTRRRWRRSASWSVRRARPACRCSASATARRCWPTRSAAACRSPSTRRSASSGSPVDDEELVPSGAWPQFHLDVVDAPPDAQVIARNDCGDAGLRAAGHPRRAVPPRGAARDPRRLVARGSPSCSSTPA